MINDKEVVGVICTVILDICWWDGGGDVWDLL